MCVYVCISMLCVWMLMYAYFNINVCNVKIHNILKKIRISIRIFFWGKCISYIQYFYFIRRVCIWMLMYAYFNMHVCNIEIHNIEEKKYVFLYLFFFGNTYFIYWVFLFQYTCVYLNVDVCVFQYTCMQHWNTQHFQKKYVFLYVFFFGNTYLVYSVFLFQ